MPPPPKPADQRRRRNATFPMRQLPRGGYQGHIPAWPLPDPTAREFELWDDLWRTPQAAAWIELDWFHEVAMYVRWVRLGEEGSRAATDMMLKLGDRIGISPIAMLKLRWAVSEDELASARSTSKSRDRLEAVD